MGPHRYTRRVRGRDNESLCLSRRAGARHVARRDAVRLRDVEEYLQPGVEAGARHGEATLGGVDAVVAQEAGVRHEGVHLRLHLARVEVGFVGLRLGAGGLGLGDWGLLDESWCCRGDERQDGGLLRRVREVDAAEYEQRVGVQHAVLWGVTRRVTRCVARCVARRVAWGVCTGRVHGAFARGICTGCCVVREMLSETQDLGVGHGSQGRRSGCGSGAG